MHEQTICILTRLLWVTLFKKTALANFYCKAFLKQFSERDAVSLPPNV